nr:hypothetical protein CFP56_34717 [Quercus suber]
MVHYQILHAVDEKQCACTGQRRECTKETSKNRDQEGVHDKRFLRVVSQGSASVVFVVQGFSNFYGARRNCTGRYHIPLRSPGLI